MSKEELFTAVADAEAMAPEQSRSPLGAYTLAEMPGDLAAIRGEEMGYDELRAKQEALLQEVAPQIIGNTDRDVAALTQLDLTFMLGGYLPLGEDTYRAAPPQLLGLLEQQADRFGLPARMDYELVIDVNTEEYKRTGHMRTFTEGEIGLSERDFYRGHNESEVYVKSAAYQLRSLIENPETVDADGVLQAALGNMKTFREYMAAYMRMTIKDFGTFRPYLASYPDGARNASGAFMPSVQLAELALHTPTDGLNTYIDESMPYFPSWARPVIKGWREQSMRGRNVVTLVTEKTLQLGEDGAEALKGLTEEFLTFRTTHLAATRKQVPEAFEGQKVPVGRKQIAEFGEPDIMAGGTKGTAGFHVSNILGGAAYRLAHTREELDRVKQPEDNEEVA